MLYWYAVECEIERAASYYVRSATNNWSKCCTVVFGGPPHVTAPYLVRPPTRSSLYKPLHACIVLSHVRSRRKYDYGRVDSADGIACRSTCFEAFLASCVIPEVQWTVRPGSRGCGAGRVPCYGVDTHCGVPKAGEDVLAKHDTPSAGPGLADVAPSERPLLLLVGEDEQHQREVATVLKSAPVGL